MEHKGTQRILKILIACLSALALSSLSEAVFAVEQCHYLNWPLLYVHTVEVSSNPLPFAEELTGLNSSDLERIDASIFETIRKRLSKLDIRVERWNPPNNGHPHSMYIEYMFIPTRAVTFSGERYSDFLFEGHIALSESATGLVSGAERSMQIWEYPLTGVIGPGEFHRFHTSSLGHVEEAVALETVDRAISDLIHEVQTARRLCKGISRKSN